MQFTLIETTILHRCIGIYILYFIPFHIKTCASHNTFGKQQQKIFHSSNQSNIIPTNISLNLAHDIENFARNKKNHTNIFYLFPCCWLFLLLFVAWVVREILRANLHVCLTHWHIPNITFCPHTTIQIQISSTLSIALILNCILLLICMHNNITYNHIFHKHTHTFTGQ